MPIPTNPSHLYGALFEVERTRLLEMLRSIEPVEWHRPTACPGWTVLGLCAHLLGDDVGVLARDRDGYHGTPAADGLDEEAFIDWFDDAQMEWVTAARRLSPRLVVELLAWTGSQMVDLYASQDASSVTANVSWASDGRVPVWLDQARELSERWIHRQQLRGALGQPSDLRPDLTEPVLDAMCWAYPFRLRSCAAADGDALAITITGPEVARRWELTAMAGTWDFRSPTADDIKAELTVTTEQAWRLLTNNLNPAIHGEPEVTGDPGLAAILLRTRAIIGTPK